MAETCWYNSKRMKLDDGCNNNVNGTTTGNKENERWSCNGDTSLVEPEILEDMGVGMLADGEGSRESLQNLKTQECTISPKIFEADKLSKNGNVTYGTQESFKSASFVESANIDGLDPFERDDAVNFSAINNESGYSSRVEQENFSEAKENFSKEDSNDSSDKTGNDPFFLFRRKKKPSVIGEDKFNKLSDEMILMILKWLPKKCLVRSMLVCKRWCQIARDEALWTRLDLGAKVLSPGTLGHIIPKGVQILRLAQADIVHPVFLPNSDICIENYISKLQYLDLSSAVVDADDLADLLSKCRCLKKLSLEKCTMNKLSCEAISKNPDLEVLNLTMCEGIDTDCLKDLMKLRRFTSLNISWCSLDSESMTYLCKTLTSSITRLNIAGCRKTLSDDNIKDLVKCCPHLKELDLSDCTELTLNTLHYLMNLSDLEHLSLSRCYCIPTSMYNILACMPQLRYLNIFGLIIDDLKMKTFQAKCGNIEINKFLFSSIARPTVGVRRTSIWGLRVRD